MKYNKLVVLSRIVIISAPYYPTGIYGKEIVTKLEQGVKLAADENKWQKDFTNIPVAGALELPLALSFLAERDTGEIAKGTLGVVVLGCVIRGETEHFSLISQSVFHGLQKVALKHSIALGTGVLACDYGKQALERAEKTGRQAFNACHSLLAVKQYPFTQY